MNTKCKKCDQYKIKASESSWKKLCKECWVQQKRSAVGDDKMVPCVSCRAYKVKQSEAAFKPACFACYKSKMKMERFEHRNGATEYYAMCDAVPPKPEQRAKRPTYTANSEKTYTPPPTSGYIVVRDN